MFENWTNSAKIFWLVVWWAIAAVAFMYGAGLLHIKLGS